MICSQILQVKDTFLLPIYGASREELRLLLLFVEESTDMVGLNGMALVWRLFIGDVFFAAHH